jgi:tetratricopeptide (TPR) repeat protein
VAPLLLTFAALAAVGGGLVLHSRRLADRAEAALQDGRSYVSSERYSEAQEAYHNGEVLLAGLPFQDDLRRRLHAERQSAIRKGMAVELNAVADRARILVAAEKNPPALSDKVTTDCREIWNQREEIISELSRTDANENGLWRADLLDVGLLTAEMAARKGESDTALTLLNEAERSFGPSLAIELERVRYAQSSGRMDLAAEAKRKAQILHPSRPWEYVLVGRSYLAAGEFSKAFTALDRAAADLPNSLWANCYLGTCQLRLNKPVEAAAAFSACVALAPKAAWCLYNRGLAFLAADRNEAAKADFESALALDAHFLAAIKGRDEAVRRMAERSKK